MALKAWKKIRSSEENIVWKSKKTKEILFVGTWGKVYRWRVSLSSESSYSTLKLSKTKPQALKFARAYMRKH